MIVRLEFAEGEVGELVTDALRTGQWLTYEFDPAGLLLAVEVHGATYVALDDEKVYP